jgi:hypothetical protein
MSYICASRLGRSIVEERKGKRRGFARWAAAAVAAVLLSGLGSLPAKAQMPNSDFFPIGVHAQPKASFDKWKGRGINTLFQYEAEKDSNGNATVSLQSWSSTAASKGLYYVRTPAANPADDLQDPNLLAWAQLDEPDLSNHSPTPSVNIDIYQNWKAIAPSKPVWINFAGPSVTVAGANYTQWDKGGDWIAVDWYPINWNRESNINFIGLALDKLRADSGGVPKKYMAYIETSWQRLANSTVANTPEPPQLRGEVWSAIMHGANGIIYFPQVVPDRSIGGSFSYDGTPLDVANEMTTQDALIQKYGRVLNATRNPSSRSLSAPTYPGIIESTWRVMQEGDYFFVLNQSPNTLTGVPMTLTGLPAGAQLTVLEEGRNVSLVGNVLTDSFTPYQVHIYEAATISGSPQVPEPASLGVVGLAAACWALRRGRRREERSCE